MSEKQVVYIAGPMTGLPNYNFREFLWAEAVLELWGYRAVSPAREDIRNKRIGIVMGPDGEAHLCLEMIYAEIIEEAIKLVTEGGRWGGPVDAIALLPGWEKSNGVRLELAAAYECNPDMHVFELDTVTLCTTTLTKERVLLKVAGFSGPKEDSQCAEDLQI